VLTSALVPWPPSNPPGPPAPALGTTLVPRRPATPGDPLTSIVPATVALPLASHVTPVLAALRVNFTVMPAGTSIVVKLKTPLGGSTTVIVHGVGLHGGNAPPAALGNGPSAPVLPLTNVWPLATVADTIAANTPAVKARRRPRLVVFLVHPMRHLTARL
jgi:hypothetical protein